MSDRRQARRPAARRPAANRRQPARRGRPAARKRFPWKPALIAALVVLAVATPLVLRWVFTVRTLTVAGSGEVSAQEVARMSGIRVGVHMGSVDVERVRRGVENDGRLAFVSLDRKLPGGLVLTVRERTTEALAMQAGKVLALDSDGYVVAALDRLPDGQLPYVSGLKPTQFVVGRQLETIDGRVPAMTRILEALQASGVTGRVAEIDLSSLADIRIITRKGVTVLLGDQENIPRKVTWMAGAVADLEARGESGGRLDVSSGNKADYTPDSAAAQSAATEAEGAGEG